MYNGNYIPNSMPNYLNNLNQQNMYENIDTQINKLQQLKEQMKNNIVDNLSLALQILSLQILFQDCNNNDLMSELQTQDEKYLKTIIKNQEEILRILKERREIDGERIN